MYLCLVLKNTNFTGQHKVGILTKFKPIYDVISMCSLGDKWGINRETYLYINAASGEVQVDFGSELNKYAKINMCYISKN